MTDDLRLPNPNELGDEFQKMQELDDEAFNCFEKYAPEILKRISREKAKMFIDDYGCSELIDEDNTLEDAFRDSLYIAYESQDNLDYEEYLQDLITNHFKI